MNDTAWPRGAIPPLESITQEILTLRGQKVLIDASLAALCSVTTKRLHDQVNGNLDRFPADFLFLATEEEFKRLRPRIASLNSGRGRHRQSLPYVFTRHGVLMASMILNSHRATEIAVHVVRAFARLEAPFADTAPRQECVSLNTHGQMEQVFKVLAELVR